MDESYKIAITRLGDRIRVGGMAEISGFNNTLHPRRKATLQHSVEDLFGGAADQSQATFWSGLRPMTPDGTPILGASTVPNLWLNTGHGTLGLDHGRRIRPGAGRPDLRQTSRHQNR